MWVTVSIFWLTYVTKCDWPLTSMSQVAGTKVTMAARSPHSGWRATLASLQAKTALQLCVMGPHVAHPPPCMAADSENTASTYHRRVYTSVSLSPSNRVLSDVLHCTPDDSTLEPECSCVEKPRDVGSVRLCGTVYSVSSVETHEPGWRRSSGVCTATMCWDGRQGPESLAQWVALRTARASVDVMAFSGWPDCLHNLDTVTGFPVCSSRFSQKLTVLSWRWSYLCVTVLWLYAWPYSQTFCIASTLCCLKRSDC